jgi:hypothetical protein
MDIQSKVLNRDNSTPTIRGLNKNHGNTSKAGSVPCQLLPRPNKKDGFIPMLKNIKPH